jgi:hypothetical protein
MRRARHLAAFVAILVACVLATRVAAAENARAVFALIVGSNQSVDADVAPLHYADDDAARYFDLFRLLGMRTVLLARIDDSTKKLHPQAAAEAQLPRRAAFTAATTALAAEVAEARRRGLDTVLYFVFAGHGGVEDARGYVALEDARLSGDALGAEVVSRIGAQSVHVILDACNSYLVAYSRGPGGTRRPAQDFAHSVYELGRDPRVGLLLSTSSATESHEWDAFQAGVFSHEVRSGLYGAADADGDGAVSYREIAAFVARANEAIENDRFRPRVFARPPAAKDELLDLRSARRRIAIDGAHAGRYLLEDARGIRLADFHSPPGQDVLLVRPPPVGRAYLRRLDDDREFVIVPGDGPVAVADLSPELPRVSARGAIHESFSRIFSLPFGRGAVDAYVAPPPPLVADAPPPRDGPSVRKIVGFSLLGVGALGLGAGTYFAIHGASQPASGPNDSQAAVAARNDTVSGSNRAALFSFVGGGAVLAAGAALLLWPTSSTSAVSVSMSGDGAAALYRSSF